MTRIDARVPMRLGDLLTGIAFTFPAGSSQLELAITGISCDSRSLQPGDLFVAIQGTHLDGNTFVADALGKGAAAVITDRPDMSACAGRPVIVVKDARRALAPLAANFYGHPAKDLTMVGVTGTLGKTSVALMLWHLWRQAGLSAGCMGSLGIRYKNQVFASRLTTPDALTLQRSLFEMKNSGITHVVMEVSSHGLRQHRVDTIAFQAVIFTNLLPHEHSDFHPSFSHYIEAKRTLLDSVATGGKIIYNSDSHAVESILKEWPPHDLVRFKVELPSSSAGYTLHRSTLAGQQLVARDILMSTGGSFFNLEIPGLNKVSLARIPLLGIGSVVNAVGAAACGLSLGLPVETMVRGLRSLPAMHRRMEIIYQEEFTVIDDTCGHPESFNRLFESIEAMHPAGVVMVVAIRGRRGVDINRENGKCVAGWANRIPIGHLLVTDSMDATDDLNSVEPLERDAFLQELRGNAGTGYYRSLKEAVGAGLAAVRKDYVLILAGAQGMDKGRFVLRELLGYPGKEVPYGRVNPLRDAFSAPPAAGQTKAQAVTGKGI